MENDIATWAKILLSSMTSFVTDEYEWDDTPSLFATIQQCNPIVSALVKDANIITRKQDNEIR